MTPSTTLHPTGGRSPPPQGSLKESKRADSIVGVARSRPPSTRPLSPLFTGVRGRGILRTSHCTISRKFAPRNSHMGDDLPPCVRSYLPSLATDTGGAEESRPSFMEGVRKWC